jgi:hypothetical protein
MDKPARAAVLTRTAFQKKKGAKGKRTPRRAVEVRLPSPEDDYAEPDFESVFSTSHQLAP